ncbi:hypothetical protein ACFZ8E_05735 [Methylobacterium sp. HMF5984]|uniref:hypothetical protein n=1 Tax=Methylobacterium sp. HMF5984 TaxID=3367370 RepID=UPI003853C0D8
MTTSRRGLFGMLAAAHAALGAGVAAALTPIPQRARGYGRVEPWGGYRYQAVEGSHLTESEARRVLMDAIAANNAERDRTVHARAEVARRRFG